MVSGRELQKKYSFIIFLCRRSVKLFPVFLVGGLISITSSIGGRFFAFLRYVLYSRLFSELGGHVYFGERIVIRNPSGVNLGNGVSIHPFCYLDGYGGLCIGDNVSIAHGCSILTFEHQWDQLGVPIKYNPVNARSVKIENDVWIGCGVRVLSGSYIESRVVVAAGSVVKGRLESGWIYGGVPAKKLKKL